MFASRDANGGEFIAIADLDGFGLLDFLERPRVGRDERRAGCLRARRVSQTHVKAAAIIALTSREWIGKDVRF